MMWNTGRYLLLENWIETGTSKETHPRNIRKNYGNNKFSAGFRTLRKPLASLPRCTFAIAQGT